MDLMGFTGETFDDWSWPLDQDEMVLRWLQIQSCYDLPSRVPKNLTYEE